MPNRLVGILVCLLLANIAAYALGSWVDHIIDLQSVTVTDSESTLNRFAGLDFVFTQDPDQSYQPANPLQSFDFYIAGEGTAYYLTFLANVLDEAITQPIKIAQATDTVRIAAASLLLLAVLLFIGRGLREERFTTPLIIIGYVIASAALLGAFQAPLFTSTVALALVLYVSALRLLLPVYTTEISQLLRPFLTPCVALLAVMVWRGPELVDYLFWTSAWFRFILCFVWLMAHFFHFANLDRVLRRVDLSFAGRIFAYALPLGLTWTGVGLLLGSYGEAAGAGLGQLNRELLLVPQAMTETLNPEAPFALFFAGATLLILGGIGHYVQRIAG